MDQPTCRSAGRVRWQSGPAGQAHLRQHEVWCRTHPASGREPGLEVPPFAPRSRSLGLGANDGGVDHQPFEIRLAGDSFKQSIEHAHLDPAIIASFRRLIRAKALRKITPTRARARYPQQRVKETSAITARTALAFTAARNELLDLLPLIIPKYFSSRSTSPSKADPPKVSLESDLPPVGNPLNP